MLKIAFEVYTEITVGILLIGYKMYTVFGLYPGTISASFTN